MDFLAASAGQEQNLVNAAIGAIAAAGAGVYPFIRSRWRRYRRFREVSQYDWIPSDPSEPSIPQEVREFEHMVTRFEAMLHRPLSEDEKMSVARRILEKMDEAREKMEEAGAIQDPFRHNIDPWKLPDRAATLTTLGLSGFTVFQIYEVLARALGWG